MPIFGENNRGWRTLEAATGSVILLGTAAIVAKIRHDRTKADHEKQGYLRQLQQFSDPKVDPRIRYLMSQMAAQVYAATFSDGSVLQRRDIEKLLNRAGINAEPNLINESLNRLDNGLLIRRPIPQDVGRPGTPLGYGVGTLRYDPTEPDSLERIYAPTFCDAVDKLLAPQDALAEELAKSLRREP